MEPDSQLSLYRNHLLETLGRRASWGPEDELGRLQVFVNHERVGALDCTRADPSFLFTGRDRIIHIVEVRSESGKLVGGVCAPEYGLRTARFPLSRHAVEATIHNGSDGGTVALRFLHAQAWWRRAHAAAADWAGHAGLLPREGAWMPLLVGTQAAVAAVVLFLVVDRFVGGPVLVPAPTAAVSEAQVVRLERAMERLIEDRAATQQIVQRQQDELTKVAQVLKTVAATQQKLTSDVGAVQQVVATKEQNGDGNMEQLTRALLGKAETERQQMRRELHSLTAANEALSRQLSTLAGHTEDLKNRLTSAGVDVSKVQPVADKDVMVAEKPAETNPPQTADARESAQPFTFWVTFQEGASEESIEHLIREIHGRKGSLNAGWYPVEVTPPPADPPDRFLESLRHAKIVKAVRVSHPVQ